MELTAGLINKRLLHQLLLTHTRECNEVRAAIAYASADKIEFLEACRDAGKPLTFYGRYDDTVPVAPEIIEWFLKEKNPDLICKAVPEFLHAKIIWWVGIGAYIGSANLTERAWTRNIEAGSFLTEEEMDGDGMLEELRLFFDVIDERAHDIDDKYLLHLRDLRRRREVLDVEAGKLRKRFEEHPYFKIPGSLADVDAARAKSRAYDRFAKDWNQSLQFLRDIGKHVSEDEYRPSWIPDTVPEGAQADQFLHAYYYKQIKGHLGRARVDAAYEGNRNRRMAALEEALDWWKASDFDYEQERTMLLDSAQRLVKLLDRDSLRTISRSEFVEALSMVHAVKDYSSKRKNRELGLPASPQPLPLKLKLHVEQMWDARSSGGHSARDVLWDVIWGSGPVQQRIWRAVRDNHWSIPGLGFSALGETVGWAKPNEYPPRNDRTLKALRALGYPVKS